MSTASNSQLLATTKRDFHELAQQLFLTTQEPIRPQNYRSGTFPQSKSHTLLHEEEQHLADHIAVLAQAKEGAAGVSAAMIEKCNGRDSPSLTIRIASNKTPLPETVDGLRRCLDIVEEAARAETDEHKDVHKSNLLMQIIKLSKGRLRRRIGPPKNRGGKVRLLLSDRVKPLRCRFLVLEINVGNTHLRSSLCVNISDLCQKIASFTLSSEESQLNHLTVIVLAAHKVSTTANNPSFEHQLQMKGLISGPDSAPSIGSRPPHPSSLYDCRPQDLPITILISPDNPLDTIILSIGKVEYILDIRDVEFGYLNIRPTKQIDVLTGREQSQSKALAEGNHEGLRLIDVRGSELDVELVLTGRNSDSREVQVFVNDGGECSICVKIVRGVEEG
ncbi:hypothetical protein BOTNAR_0168g00090 [Botryotinia narcissicola]|uniref:Uncharacterized protein n=1 Tax=Botryotinia narcissicola TaxID=278944 RepID=A0A4Z1ICU5_9HELO|nr:hypothetical protein BOTNAR_0168g00090 [Botryotinia narcissicola]